MAWHKSIEEEIPYSVDPVNAASLPNSNHQGGSPSSSESPNESVLLFFLIGNVR
jgi:hypothetical protein